MLKTTGKELVNMAYGLKTRNDDTSLLIFISEHTVLAALPPIFADKWTVKLHGRLAIGN